MGVHFAVVAFKGSHLGRMADFLRELDYELVGAPASCTSGEEAMELLNEESDNVDIVRKAAYESGGWTYLVDPEMVVITSVDELTAFAQTHATRILGLICESSSASYGFSVFAPTLQREVLAVNGEVVTNTGDAIPEERGIDWRRADERQILTVAERFGVAYDEMSADRPYLVFTLDESGMPTPELPASAADRPFPPVDIVARVVGRRPWWKFW